MILCRLILVKHWKNNLSIYSAAASHSLSLSRSQRLATHSAIKLSWLEKPGRHCPVWWKRTHRGYAIGLGETENEIHRNLGSHVCCLKNLRTRILFKISPINLLQWEIKFEPIVRSYLNSSKQLRSLKSMQPKDLLIRQITRIFECTNYMYE
jgi:hypothetical protein